MFENAVYNKAKAMLKRRENIDIEPTADWTDILYAIGLYFGGDEQEEWKQTYIREGGIRA